MKGCSSSRSWASLFQLRSQSEIETTPEESFAVVYIQVLSGLADLSVDQLADPSVDLPVDMLVDPPVDLTVDLVDSAEDPSAGLDLSSVVCNCGHLYPVTVFVSSVSSPLLFPFCLVLESWI